MHDTGKVISNAAYLIFYVRKDISIQKKSGVNLDNILKDLKTNLDEIPLDIVMKA